MSAPHTPVMLEEAVASLAPVDRGIYADGTFGAGGYARALLAAANCTVYGFDRDPTAIARAEDWARAYAGRLTLINRPFADMKEALKSRGVEAIDGAVFDLGVSSMQFDEAERGFSFMRDGPLSMRMDAGRPDASDFVNDADPRDLAAVFKTYGEEKRSGRIARAIAEARKSAPIETTARLAEIVARASPARREDKIHPATRVFQAIRIFVNDELSQLARALFAAERLLRPAGRLVVVTFHSLEDRIVKRFLTERGGAAPRASRHAPDVEPSAATFRLLSDKPQTPSAREIADNPRARSAKLRAAIRTDAPAAGGDYQDFLPALALSKSFPAWS